MRETDRVAGCPSENTIIDFVGGRLAHAETQQLHQHFDECSVCRKLLALFVPSAPPPPSSSPSPGERFAVESELARGGLGVVLRARDRRLERVVALKRLLAPSPAGERRFRREALMTAQLQHPSIVPVYDAGELPSGEPFYAMKLVAGRPLDDLIDEARTLDERLALLPHVISVAEAVAYAHNQGVIHRDLKPANVLVGEYGETVVIDWGLAKRLREDDAPLAGGEDVRAGLTVDGAVMGTPAYMPPEQALGHAVDARADVYAIGAMLYQLLAGHAPYRGSARELIERVIADPPPPIESLQRGVPPDLATLVNKAMARAPADRYPTANGLARDLVRFQTGRLVTAHRYSRRVLFARWVRRNRAPVGVGAALALALAAVVIAAAVRVRHDRRALAAGQRELLFDRARAALAVDPTRAIALLRGADADVQHSDEARRIAVDAAGRGVAETIVHGRPGGELAMSPDGTRLASGGELINLQSGVRRPLAPWRWARFSADGEWLVTALGNEITFWDRAGAPHAVLVPGRAPLAIEALPDGSSAVAAGADGSLWIVGRDRTRRLVGRHAHAISAIALSPDGQRLVSSDEDAHTAVWQLASGEERAIDTGYYARELAWAPNGKGVVATSLDGGLVYYDAATWHRWVLGGFRAPPGRSVAWSPDSKWLASTAANAVASIWQPFPSDLIDPQQPEAQLYGHTAEVTAITFDPTGRWLLSGDARGGLRLWTVDDAHGRPLDGHHAAIDAVAFTPDGARLVSRSSDGEVRIWDPPREMTAEALAARYALDVGVHDPAHQRVLFAHDVLQTWNVTTGEQDGAAIWVWLPKERPRVIRFSPDPRRVAVALSSPVVELFDGEQRPPILDGDPRRLTLVAPAVDLDFAPDGVTLAIVDEEGRLYIWTPMPLPLPGRTEFAQAQATRARWSPDGKQLAVATRDGLVRLWTRDGGPGRVLARDVLEPTVLSWSPDGGAIFYGDKLAGLARVDVPSGAAQRWPGPTAPVTMLAWSRDGKWLAGGGAEPTAWLWRAADGDAHALHGPAAATTMLEFSPDGTRLAVGDAEGSVWIFDRAGRPFRALHADDRAVLDLVFARDDELWTLAGSHVLRRWKLSPERDGPAGELAPWLRQLTHVQP